MISEHVHSMDELLAQLQVRGLIDDKGAAAIAVRLGKPESHPNFSAASSAARIVQGLGAWFSAACFIAFLAVSEIASSESALIGSGIALLALAVLIGRKEKNAFLSQLALALAFAGNVMTILGAATTFHGSGNLSAAFLVQAAICLAVCPFCKSYVYRFLAPTALAALAMSWIADKNMLAMLAPLIGAEMLLAGMLLLHEARPRWLDPLAYSAAVSLPATLLCMNVWQAGVFWMPAWQGGSSEPFWLSSLLLAAGLAFLLIHLAGSSGHSLRKPWMMLAMASIVLLGVFATPGILAAIGLLVLGRALGDRALTVLGLLFLPCFLATFYYALHVDLAHKSWIIAGSGVLLLAVRMAAGACQAKEENK